MYLCSDWPGPSDFFEITALAANPAFPGSLCLLNAMNSTDHRVDVDRPLLHHVPPVYPAPTHSVNLDSHSVPDHDPVFRSAPDTSRPEFNLLVAGCRGGESLPRPPTPAQPRIRQNFFSSSPPRHKSGFSPDNKGPARLRRKVRPGMQCPHLLHPFCLNRHQPRPRRTTGSHSYRHPVFRLQGRTSRREAAN